MSILKKLEWSGRYEDATGSRMGHPEDSDFYPACPSCGGIKPTVRADHLKGYATFGHKKGCELAAEIE